MNTRLQYEIYALLKLLVKIAFKMYAFKVAEADAREYMRYMRYLQEYTDITNEKISFD